MGKRLKIIWICFTVMVLAVLLCATEWYRMHTDAQIKPLYRRELAMQGARALPGLDVPVGAILVYNDSIIGRGYNTVKCKGNAGGHAEINAVSDALMRYGYEGFMHLDRSQLVLYSTFEPCPMCRGAKEEYHIKKVIFIKPKTLWHWLHNDLADWAYDWRKRISSKDSLQDSLFMKHPSYRP